MLALWGERRGVSSARGALKPQGRVLGMNSGDFTTLIELEPPRTAQLERVKTQAELLGPVSDLLLLPDNHLGLAALSSLATAIEVKRWGWASAICLNARDRSLTGLQSDLLTAKAFGINHVVFVYGDRPVHGARMRELNVERMLEASSGLYRGVAAPLGRPLDAWRKSADFLITEPTFDLDQLEAFRQMNEFDGHVLAGVVALPDEGVGRQVAKNVKSLSVPQQLWDRLQTDRDAGIVAAVDLIHTIRSRGLADGVHLVVPGGRARLAAHLKGVP